MKKMVVSLYNKGMLLADKLKEKALSIVKQIFKKVTNSFNTIKIQMPVWIAQVWQYYYRVKNKLFDLGFRYRVVFTFLVIIGLLVLSWLSYPVLNNTLQLYFSTQSRFEGLQTLFVSLGGAMIGATAIAFSLIMFAMQINVERMPHGLFKKFSSDVKLLGTFTVTFSLAVIITGLSLIPEKSWVAGAVISAVWSLVLIILLFLFAYRRALGLINPAMQLFLIVADTKINFKIWDKAVKRTAPIIRANTGDHTEDEEIREKYDMDRVTYFKLHPQWSAVAEQAISYCITFSRRYADQGDHEVSQIALNGIVTINALYIRAKGKTFFSNNYFIDNPLASDSFLTNTLEHLRQNVQVGITRKDEQFIEQNLRILVQLTQLYLFIKYGDEHATHSHAHLVSSYLTGAVETIVPHDMADVLIEGVTLLGNVARLIVLYDKPEYTTSISEKIALIACTGTVNKNYRAVTQVAVKQLASLTFELLRSKSLEVRYAIKKVRDDVKLIAEMYLKVPDAALTRIHSVSLGPYYSGTSNDTLMSWLTDLTNALSKADTNDEAAQRVIRHIVEWADGLFRTEKDLLLLAIEKRSQFTFDLVHWIVHITKLLLAVSCADACDDHDRAKLRKSAQFLIYVLSWIPDTEETIKYVETYRIADNIFEASVDAKKRGCNEVALKIRELLLSWTYKAGKYQTGWGSLETACCGLACLNLILELPDEKLFSDIDTYLSKEDAPSFDIRSRTASDLHEEADKYRTGYGHGDIDIAMSRVDQARFRVLLNGVADHLLPEITNIDSLDETDDADDN